MTVLKPLFGAEPMLEQALASLCAQDYPAFQVVFGVQDPADPAVAVVRRIQARFPQCDIALVVDPTPHGRNRKVGNLINMMAAARHDVLVIADSDVHAAPDYLTRIVAALEPAGDRSGDDAVCRSAVVAFIGRGARGHQHNPRLPAGRADGAGAWAAGLPGRHDGAAARDAGGDRRLSRAGA